MGSSASKRRRNFTAIDLESEAPSSRTSTLVKKRKKNSKKHGDTISVSSLDSKVSSLDVSFIPNGKIGQDKKEVTPRNHVNVETVRPGKPSKNKPSKHADTDSLKSTASHSGSVKPESRNPTPKPPRVIKVTQEMSIKSHSRNNSSHDLDFNDNKLKTDSVGIGASNDDVQVFMTHPDYNGGGALPKKGNAQDALSRLMKNGIGTGKKSSFQLLFDGSRDDSKKKLSQLCDVAFLPSGSVAISNSDVGKPGVQLYSLSDSGRPGAVLGQTFLNAPRGICAGGPNDWIAVTDWADRNVQFMNMDGEFVNSWKKNKFQHPGGIAVNQDGRYVITDLKRKEAAIGLYTPYGKLLRRFGRSSFDWPWYVTVDRRNRILVSERQSGTINVFDDVGRFLFKFGGAETNGTSGRSVRAEEQFNAPGGLAVDSQNNILVADTDNYRVVMFSSDGIFIKTVLTSRFSRPISVSYDDGHLAVVTDSDLRVYKTYSEKTSL